MISALYMLCVEYHSGQWSKGYHILSLCLRYAGRWGIGLPEYYSDLSRVEREIYKRLQTKYAAKL